MSLFFYVLSETIGLHLQTAFLELNHVLLFKEIPVSSDLLRQFRFSYMQTFIFIN